MYRKIKYINISINLLLLKCQKNTVHYLCFPCIALYRTLLYYYKLFDVLLLISYYYYYYYSDLEKINSQPIT